MLTALKRQQNPEALLSTFHPHHIDFMSVPNSNPGLSLLKVSTLFPLP